MRRPDVFVRHCAMNASGRRVRPCASSKQFVIPSRARNLVFLKLSSLGLYHPPYAFALPIWSQSAQEKLMARETPPLGGVVKEIEAAWVQPQADWARTRLLVVRLIAQHELTTGQIAKVAGVSRKSVFNYRDIVKSGGVPAL